MHFCNTSRESEYCLFSYVSKSVRFVVVDFILNKASYSVWFEKFVT